MSAWSSSDIKRNMSRKMGGKEGGEDETAAASSAAPLCCTKWKARGSRSLSFHVTHISEKQGIGLTRTYVILHLLADCVHVFVCMAVGSPLCASFSFQFTSLPSHTQKAARATICARGSEWVRGWVSEQVTSVTSAGHKSVCLVECVHFLCVVSWTNYWQRRWQGRQIEKYDKERGGELCLACWG